MKTVFSIIMTAGILMLLLGTQTVCAEPPLVVAAEFEGGKLYRAGTVSVVELNGNYRQMGRQYGMLLKRELTDLYAAAVETFFMKERNVSRGKLHSIARAVFEPYPQRYKELLYGSAETSGLSMEQIILLNALEWYPKIFTLSPGKCSGIAAWGPYTPTGALVFGRNNDDDVLYKRFASFMVVAVFNADDGSLPAALVNYAGVIYNATGMNREGLFMELNAGPWMGFSLERQSIFVSLFSFLQDYASVADVHRAFVSTLPNLASIVNVADRSGAVSYEMSLYDTRSVEPQSPGLLVSSNHFVSSSWPLAAVEDDKAGWTGMRRANLLALAGKHKGGITHRTMMQILDVPIERGGATVEGTIYQVVAVPATRTFWIKMPGIQDWTEIPLKPLFRAR